jgi:hypothetical protein
MLLVLLVRKFPTLTALNLTKKENRHIVYSTGWGAVKATDASKEKCFRQVTRSTVLLDHAINGNPFLDYV